MHVCVFWLLLLLLGVCCAAETKSNVREVIFWLFFSIEEELCSIDREVMSLTPHWTAVHAG